LLFEYSSQGSCPGICLEALQVILLENIFCHRLLSVMHSLCFVKVSLYVLTLLQSVRVLKTVRWSVANLLRVKLKRLLKENIISDC
jgi:hypothetical protein